HLVAIYQLFQYTVFSPAAKFTAIRKELIFHLLAISDYFDQDKLVPITFIEDLSVAIDRVVAKHIELIQVEIDYFFCCIGCMFPFFTIVGEIENRAAVRVFNRGIEGISIEKWASRIG